MKCVVIHNDTQEEGTEPLYSRSLRKFLTALQNIRKAVFVSLKKEPAIRGSLANNK